MGVPTSRSENMRALRGRNTTPELAVRHAAHRLGLRFRLHRSDLPGKPDLTFAKWRTVLFVNGCFWHQHSGCKKATIPKTNVDFWRAKLSRNGVRDVDVNRRLIKSGWRVLTVWECQTRSSAELNGILLGVKDRLSEVS